MIGRYQPFHKGHSNLVKQILAECEEIIIGIGSSQFNYTFSNPFTAGERTYMIHKTLVDEKNDLNRIYLSHIINLENNAIWLEHVKSNMPRFEAIYTGNKFVKELVKNDGSIRVETPKFIRKSILNGTYIRNCMVRNKIWKELVPMTVYRIIGEIDGISRIKMLYNTQVSLPI